MKNDIIEKLWSTDNALSSEEILFISRNLQDEGDRAVKFDHARVDTFGSCGVTEEDKERFNLVYRELCEKKGGNIETVSEIVEISEDLIGDPKFRRLMLIQAVMYSKEQNNPLRRLLDGL